MPVLGDFLLTLVKLLDMILGAYKIIVIMAVIMSWFRPDPYNPIVRVIYQLTQPVFNWVRRWMPRALFRMGIDFSPIIVLLLLVFIESFLLQQLARLAIKLSI